MKKLLLLSLALISAVSVHAAGKSARQVLVEHVETCEAILHQFQDRPETAIPREVLQKARGLIIVNQFNAGFVLGMKGGYGVVMVKKPDNRWSLPEDEARFKLVNNDQTPRFLQDFPRNRGFRPVLEL